MKKIFLAALLSLCIFTYIIPTPHVLTFFFEPYPDTTSDTTNPHVISGIPVSYFGFLNYSDHNGQIIFERRHQEPIFNILVTKKIKPIFMLHKTVAHWEIQNPKNAAFYHIEKQQDAKTKAHFWTITKQKLPKKNRIPIKTIMILADANTVFVPTGISLTTKNNQLVLPHMYVKEQLYKPTNALSTIDLRTLFGSIKQTYSLDKMDIKEQISEKAPLSRPFSSQPYS